MAELFLCSQQSEKLIFKTMELQSAQTTQEENQSTPLGACVCVYNYTKIPQENKLIPQKMLLPPCLTIPTFFL